LTSARAGSITRTSEVDKEVMTECLRKVATIILAIGFLVGMVVFGDLLRQWGINL